MFVKEATVVTLNDKLLGIRNLALKQAITDKVFTQSPAPRQVIRIGKVAKTYSVGLASTKPIPVSYKEIKRNVEQQTEPVQTGFFRLFAGKVQKLVPTKEE